jgi:hypothetical protein
VIGVATFDEESATRGINNPLFEEAMSNIADVFGEAPVALIPTFCDQAACETPKAIARLRRKMFFMN